MPTPPPEVAILPAEVVVQAWLIAGLTPVWPQVAARVSDELPATEVWPFIRLNRSGGVSEPYVDHVQMTIELWAAKGDSQQAAYKIKDIVALVPTLYGQVMSGVWVVNTQIVTGPFSSQDPDTLNPRQLLELAFDMYHV
jgi:hypothetical protein